jgi:hypothetical protein
MLSYETCIINYNFGDLQLVNLNVSVSKLRRIMYNNSIFFIFLNQIKAQRDQKIIVWVEYFPYKYSFKVISND